jgi:hypothetical protein
MELSFSGVDRTGYYYVILIIFFASIVLIAWQLRSYIGLDLPTGK